MHNQIHPASAGFANNLVRSEITQILQPYLRYVEGWQLRSSYLRAQLAVHPEGSDEHDLACRRLGELRREIESHRRFLAGEAGRLPPDDRIDATIDELARLLERLRAASAGNA
jgi:hypothetical protein